jgi:phosphoribosylformylglycinamidine (FGAM) synthase PurS component
MANFEIEWKVDDGYIGHASHYAEIDLDDISDLKTEEEVKSLVEQIVKEEYEERVKFCVEGASMNAVIEAWKLSRNPDSEES